ncbi:MAG: phenol hydroxylase subunit P4 [Rhodomicrobium sp.]
MSVVALEPGYGQKVEYRDVEKNFHGNALIYVHWEKHLSFCAALAFPLPLAMPFAAFVNEVVKPHYAAHPDASRADWSDVQWMIDGRRVNPQFDKSLAENGMHHKSLVRFWTPGFDGFRGSAS